jgi:uncharacterized membrane protein
VCRACARYCPTPRASNAAWAVSSLTRAGFDVQIAVGFLLLIVIWSVVKRFFIDMPNLAAGTMPEDEFDHRYVEQPWLAYLHIVPGALYLLLAPLQLAYRIRSRHYTFHRRLGRVLATAGMISGVFALIFGGLFSFGGLPEASAAVVFGLWFLTCLVLAVRAIRRNDIVHHRRWTSRELPAHLISADGE